MRKTHFAAIGACAAVGACAAIAAWPPDLIRVGANYTAKIVCSNVFLANRDPQEVLRTDVQAPGHPLLKLMRVSVDRDRGVVRAGLFGFIGGGLAVARPGEGCAAVPDGQLSATQVPTAALQRAAALTPTAERAPIAASGPTVTRAPTAASEPAYERAPSIGAMASDAAAARDGSAAYASGDLEWPDGDATPAMDAGLQRLIADAVLAGPGARAVVVIHDGRLVAESYGTGFDRRTPQLGWSMAKSVTAGLIGLLVNEGRLSLDESAKLSGEGRERIRVADFLDMSSGLEFNEGYGAVSDVTRMLYLERDMAAFARAKPLIHTVGAVWSYSSGSAVILSRIFQEAAGTAAVAQVRRWFDALDMKSAILETDESGTLVGSSYLYATPRDWARFGQFLLQDGSWKGQQMLPQGYVAMMVSPVTSSGGEYGHGLVWRWATRGDKPGENPNLAFGIPNDIFWMSGHDGQYVAIIPSRRLVIVRMGLTPAREHYRPEPLVRAVLEMTRAR